MQLRFHKQVFIVFALLTFNFSHATTNPKNSITIGSSVINVSFAPGANNNTLKLGRKRIVDWIEQSANAVADYYQVFPVEKLNIAINPSSGYSRRPINGIAYHGEIPLIVITLNTQTNERGLREDWVLVHELVHLGFPPVRRRHHWIEEGLATYVEPIARVRAGMMDEKDAWKWLMTGVPNGLPAFGDRGLDFTPTWGRTYWGGALFFLLADIRIHQQTNNRLGIEHALRAIQNAGGTMAQETTWPIEKILEIGDKATGTNVLSTLYVEMKDKPMKPDLKTIWKQLGIQLKNKDIVFNDSARDVELRKSLILN